MKITTNRKTPLSGMMVVHHMPVQLTGDEVDLVFWKRLFDLTDQMWIHEGFLWRTLDMHGHGSDIDQKIAPVEDGPYNLEIAAIRLRQEIMKAAEPAAK